MVHNDFGECQSSDFIIICVPTPLGDDGPDNSHLERACRKVGQNISEGCIVSIESTLAPTTMEKVVKPLLEKNSDLKAGEDFYFHTFNYGHFFNFISWC